MTGEKDIERITALEIWKGEVEVSPLVGGITNLNYLVTDAGARYVVRLGTDIVEHHVMRFNELAAGRAAHEAGLSPAIVHAEPGVTVIEYIESKTLTEDDIRAPGMLEKIVPLVRACHDQIPNFLHGPALIFWVFHVIRDYASMLENTDSSHCGHLPEFRRISDSLESTAGPFDIVFGHNDLLSANFLDDGKRLWLIDWDYAGFNTPLFDLGGLASNNGLSEAQEVLLLELYFDAPVAGDLMRRYQAMKCASLLRETMWSMVSEQTSALDVDFAAYTAENLGRFQSAYEYFRQT